MKWHLDFNPETFPFKINHADHIFLIGSCFSEHIGNRLAKLKFKTLSNPDGILFNPLSIHHSILSVIHKQKSDAKFLFERDAAFLSYHHHSKIKANSINELISLIDKIELFKRDFIQRTQFLFITFGTAYYYFHKQLNIAVSNCHKQDSNLFEKKLLSVSEIVETYNLLLTSIFDINPELKIIFTVSPVKHLKDGMIENNISKSTLCLSIHEICKHNKNCFYFPAFELVNDDLRDYRFYKEDMAHPSEQAINYVWEKFSNSSFDTKTKLLNQEIGKLNIYLNHTTDKTQESEDHASEKYINKQKQIIQNLNPEIEF
jgi:hypothetical protein